MNNLIIRDEQTKARAIDIVSHIDTARPMELSLKQYRKKRSLSQNGLYRMWIDIIRNEFGYEHDEMCDELKKKFLPAPGRFLRKGLDGQEREYLTTTKLNTQEMSEYMNSIDRFAASYGIILPHPQDVQAM